MKLKSIEVHNFRSITRTQRLELESGLTVILGPNNEGKSNLLRAIVLAMRCLSSIRRPDSNVPGSTEENRYRLFPRTYEWETDFPQHLQAKNPDGTTKLVLEFELTDTDRQRFRKTCDCTINNDLTVELEVGSRGTTFRTRNKKGKGAQSYKSKARQIAQFLSQAFDFQYIPAIRPSKLSLDVVGRLIERELSSLESDESYKSAMQTIEELQKPILERLGKEVKSSLEKLLPSIKDIQLNFTTVDQPGVRTRLPQFVVDDGTATDLEAKGDGIKSLVAISLLRASKAAVGTGDLVVAIEEPESHLHPGAVRGLAQVLQEMAAEHQVIITTHSPLLVARTRMQANIIVSASRATPAQSISEVRDSLGVLVEDNLRSAEYVLVVEGKTDAKALRAVFAARSAEFAELLTKGRLVFDDLEGASNVAYKLRTLQLNVASPIILVDDDSAGRDCVKKATKDGQLSERFIFQWKRPKGQKTELEDVYSPDVYWDTLSKEFGVKLDRAAFDKSADDWSTRMKSQFESGGKPWSGTTESNVKAKVAELVTANPADAISNDFHDQVDRIIESICRLVSEP